MFASPVAIAVYRALFVLFLFSGGSFCGGAGGSGCGGGGGGGGGGVGGCGGNGGGSSFWFLSLSGGDKFGLPRVLSSAFAA